MIALLGYIAAFCTTFAFLPQALKTLREKDTRAISLITYVSLTTGVFCWFVYGIFQRDIPLVAANGITFLFAGSILLMKLRYK